MALSEAQILRYSRQILLSQVGGLGQERLLSSPVTALGQGPAQATALAYLAAGGTPVVLRDGEVHDPERGFLFAADAVGASTRHTLKAALAALNREVLGSPPCVPAAIREGEGELAGAAPWVVMGQRGGEGVVVHRTEQGCAACFRGSTRGLAPCAPGPLAVAVGSLAALVFQRAVLGMAGPLGVQRVSADGALVSGAVQRCGECAA